MRNAELALLFSVILLASVVSSGCLGGGDGAGTGTSTPTSTGTTPTTETGTAPATWETPWDAYHPIKLDGKSYYVTYIRYTFTVKTPDGERTYDVEKRRGYIRAHVYADENGKKDLGEFNLFAYYGKITPEGSPNATFEYLVAVKERTEDTDQYFLQPLPNLGALATGTGVLIEAKSKTGYLFWSNPAAIGRYSELPYTEGDLNELMEGLGEYIVQGWVAMMGSGAWGGLEGHDLMKKDEYSFSFAGMSYSYRIEPDGSVTRDGKRFRVSKVEWTYSLGETSMQGKATISPALPVPIGTEGTFVSMSQGAKMYSKLEIEDIKLEEKIGGMNVTIEKRTSSGTETETETSTETQTETPSSGPSENWKLAWDASKPLEINGESYVLTGITYDITYKMAGQEVHYTMKRGYEKTDEGYKAYAVVKMDDGSIYRFEVYFSPDELEEYTGWVLWIPSTLQLTESNSPEKVVIEGPSCNYSLDEESGKMNGDISCGAEIRESPFDGIWASSTASRAESTETLSRSRH